MIIQSPLKQPYHPIKKIPKIFPKSTLHQNSLSTQTNHTLFYKYNNSNLDSNNLSIKLQHKQKFKTKQNNNHPIFISNTKTFLHNIKQLVLHLKHNLPFIEKKKE